MKNLAEAGLDPAKMPRHVGLILDGNGRWAKKRNQPRIFGHKEGSKRVLEIVKSAYSLGIPYLSFYAFSTENWKRPQAEVQGLMRLLAGFINQYLEEMDQMNIRLNIMGDRSAFTGDLARQLENALSRTANNDTMIVNIALNYGGQDEIVWATKKIAQAVKEGQLDLEDINKEVFASQLYTGGQAELDLVIRSSGELRVSNFMLYQLAYSEFWFSDIYWPDFTEDVFIEALRDFQQRDRRFGGI
ncbi:MAG: isoprenyl transferase [Tissierellia bacterium]|nr:isoprenyl transferase [Tissierellia bacterium]